MKIVLYLVTVLNLIAVHATAITAYSASIKPLLPTSTTPALGFVSIFTDASRLLVGYAGIVSHLETSLTPARCTAINGCGVHIHDGTSCFNRTTQGEHYFKATTSDPWMNERYSTDVNGKTNFQSIVQIGTTDIVGRVFIVHSRNGTRIGCGVIERTPVDQLLTTLTTKLAPAKVTSKVTVSSVEPDTACYYGRASRLEPNLVSFMNKNVTLAGKDCNVTNGCGVHLHNGTSCFNTTTQGGHLYNRHRLPVDPWLYTMYDATDSSGNAYFIGCVDTGFGVNDFVNRPFVIHSNNGTRVSCGLLSAPTSPPTPVTVPVMTPVVVPVPSSPVVTAPMKVSPDSPIMAPSSNNITMAPVTTTTASPVVITVPTSAPVRSPQFHHPVTPPYQKNCGLFRLSIFCPFSFCGIFGRLLGLCHE